MDLNQKISQAHSRSLYCSREPQWSLVVTQITAVLDQINSSPSSPLLLFPYSHARHSQRFTLSQLWHKSNPTVHQFHLLKQQKITSAKSKTFSWAREEEQLSMQTGKCQSRGRRESDLALWCQQAVTSSAVSWIRIPSLATGTVRANSPSCLWGYHCWQGRYERDEEKQHLQESNVPVITQPFDDRAVYQKPSQNSVWTKLLLLPSNLFQFF